MYIAWNIGKNSFNTICILPSVKRSVKNTLNLGYVKDKLETFFDILIIF